MQSITILQLTAHSDTTMTSTELKNHSAATSESKHPSLLAYSSMALMKNGDENEQGDEDKVTDVRALLAQKEKDLILAAELGKALLEKNEDLSQHNEKMAEEFSKQLEVGSSFTKQLQSTHPIPPPP